MISFSIWTYDCVYFVDVENEKNLFGISWALGTLDDNDDLQYVLWDCIFFRPIALGLVWMLVYSVTFF